MQYTYEPAPNGTGHYNILDEDGNVSKGSREISEKLTRGVKNHAYSLDNLTNYVILLT